MRSVLTALLALSLVACASTGNAPNTAARPAISHDVFFTLEDASDARCGELVEACARLREIPGVIEVLAGRRDETQTRDVNDQTYHVGLHVEFVDSAAYAGYGPHPVHQALLAEFSGNFERVVVFDSLVESD
ncbi:MAG: Dabb family protein [Planctomycetota bacterium]